MKLALVVHPARPSARRLALHLVQAARARGLEVVAGAHDALVVDGVVGEDVAAADAVVALGGDGTVLEAVQLALALDKPVFGVNLGVVGFLAEVEPELVESCLDRLVAGGWHEVPRMTLEALLPGRSPVVGVNDVSVAKRANERIASIAVTVDGEPFLTYRADGLLAATSTGSSAYSFSAGGPIVSPSLDVIILVPVASHALFDRALVFPPDVTLRFTAGSDRSLGVNVDARDLGELEPGNWVEVRRGPRPVRFITFGGHRFPFVVKEKFGLGDA